MHIKDNYPYNTISHSRYLCAFLGTNKYDLYNIYALPYMPQSSLHDNSCFITAPVIKNSMNWRDLHKILRESGSYKTSSTQERSFIDRLLCGMDLWLYLKLAKTIYATHRTYKGGKWHMNDWSLHSFNFLRTMEICGGRVHIEGFQNLRDSKPPYIYVSNHMSIVETLVLPVLLTTFSDVAVVLKEDLLKVPILKSVMIAINPIAVTRKNPKEDLKYVLERGKKALLEESRSVLIFPQATRNVKFDPKQFNTLGIKLAERTGMPLVPIALKTDFIRPGKVLRDFGPLDRNKIIHFKMDKPIYVDKSNGKENHEKIIEFISNSISDWENADPII